SDAFVTALASVVPADAVQKLLLLAIFVMACTSAASLVPTARLLPRLAAGVCYAWNPFVAERLLLGQWALLRGHAALPWLAAAAAGLDGRGGGRRRVRARLPAAIGGFPTLTVSALTALAVAVVSAGSGDRAGVRARARAAARVAAAAGALRLPWLVPGRPRPAGVPGDATAGGLVAAAADTTHGAPGVLRAAGVPGDETAVGLFAARAGTPFGTLGSLLLLGGVWNGETVPDGYGAPLTASLWLAVVLAALAGYGKWCRGEVRWRRG